MTDPDNKIELIRQELEYVKSYMNDDDAGIRAWYCGKAAGLCLVLMFLTDEHNRVSYDKDTNKWSVVEV